MYAFSLSSSLPLRAYALFGWSLKLGRLNMDILFLGSTTQKMKFSIKDFFSKRDQIRRSLRTWSHLLKKSLTENFIICAVECT